MKFIKRLLSGMAIGTGAAIPGVSGAAIAIICKIYEDIIHAVNGFTKHVKESIRVLLPVLFGIIIAVIPCVILFDYGFEHFMFILISVFSGFLIGSFPDLCSNVKDAKKENKHIVILLVSLSFVICLGILSIILGDKVGLNSQFDTMPFYIYLLLIPVGILASVALTVPGLSGSLILLILGFYTPMISHATIWGKEIISGNFTNLWPLLGMILCFGIGCLIGVVLVSKIMTHLLNKHHDSTFYGIIGFVLGSIVVLYLNYDIFKYYQNWMGISNPSNLLPVYVEIPLGILISFGCAFASYKLTKKAKNN